MAPTPHVPDDMLEEHRHRGPEIGRPFPDIRLPDQTGALVDLHEARAGRPALVIFYRSARW